MIAKTLEKVVATSINGANKVWDPVSIPYHEIVYIFTSIYLPPNPPHYKYPTNDE